MRRTIHFFSVLLLLGISQVCFSESQPPNIVFILADDLGYHDVSFNGGTDVQTPNIDQLAADGMKFTNFYANSTVCSPSRASLMTGRFPDLVGVPGVIRQKDEISFGYLSPSAITIADKLQYGGYHTALIGKWHLGHMSPNLPNERGFNYFKGFLAGMLDDYYEHTRIGVSWMRENEKHINPKGHATDLITDWAIDYLKDQEGRKNPFYLYLAYNAPHSPIQPPIEWEKKVKKRNLTVSEKRAKFIALVEHLDYSIGKVMKQLKDSGFDENTLVVFTSDNGGSLHYGANNGKLRGGKGDLYEGGIKVPMAVRWKNTIKPNSESNNISLLMDFYPTICKVAAVPITHKIDGISILPTLIGEKQKTDDRMLHWMRREGSKYGGRAYYATRYQNLKILQNTPYEPIQFFNLNNDISEQKPLQTNGEEYKALFKAQQLQLQNAGRVVWKEPTLD